MARDLTIGALCALIYLGGPATYLGVPYWLARRRARLLADEAEAIAMTAWLAQIRRPL